MVLIKRYFLGDKAEIELRAGYIKDDLMRNKCFHGLMRLGFEYNKLRRTFNKRYFTETYAIERWESDTNSVKELYEHYRIEDYKLVSKEGNI